MTDLLRCKKPFLDTSVFLAAINNEQQAAEGSVRAEVAAQIFKAAERKEIDLFSSSLVAAEIIYKKGSLTLSEESEPAIDEYLNNSHRPLWVDVDYSLAVDARKIVRRNGLQAADALHLAAAVRAGSDILLRWDRKFNALTTIDGVRVTDPYWYGARELEL
ncbi:MAG TPA: PIN domain-containing protein [Acidimicrobiales bacterium]|nr:PIN domain-containing protein [Acidimicrobiales bacterium]